MIGIIGAMKLETANLCNFNKFRSMNNFDFLIGELSNTEIIVTTCGPGKVNAALYTQLLIKEFNISEIINIGVAGAIDNNLNIGDIVIANSCIQTDSDTTALGDPPGLISKINVIDFKCDKNIVNNIKKAADNLNINNMIGKISTADKFINSNVDKENISKTFNCIACDMEAAAIGHVCYMYNKPYGVIRSISDKADNSSHMDYKDFIKLACKNSNKILKEYIKMKENI